MYIMPYSVNRAYPAGKYNVEAMTNFNVENTSDFVKMKSDLVSKLCFDVETMLKMGSFPGIESKL